MTDARELAIAAMAKVSGFDVVIVCTGDDMQAAYWQEKLRAGAGTVVPRGTVVLGVSEDWNGGGAGNALGTLYAFEKASRAAAAELGLDLPAKLAAGEVSVGLYHTAGKGTRLSPLPGAENNNKPAVQLPVPAQGGCATILEAVVKQTGVYGPTRRGRLSVFWGDQVFIPSAAYDAAPTHDIDILCMIGPMPGSAAEWEERGLHKYGLIAVNAQGEAAQVEKVTYDVAMQLLSSLGGVKAAGPSLGSFSVSAPMLKALLGEFAAELAAKTASLDTDPHLWMPLTLDAPAYGKIMAKKGMTAADAAAHHARMRAMLSRMGARGGRGLFGAVDVGTDAYWWDYGQLKLYQVNNLRLAAPASDREAAMMRAFYGFAAGAGGAPGGARVGGGSKLGPDLTVCADSTLSGVDLGRGAVRGAAALARVVARKVDVDGAILVNVTAPSIVAGKGAIAYNVISSGPLVLAPGEVRAGVFDASGALTVVNSTMETDGGVVWKEAVHGNALSFEKMHLANKGADVRTIGAKARAAHAAARVEIASANARERRVLGGALPAEVFGVDTRGALLAGLAAVAVGAKFALHRGGKK